MIILVLNYPVTLEHALHVNKSNNSKKCKNLICQAQISPFRPQCSGVDNFFMKLFPTVNHLKKGRRRDERAGRPENLSDGDHLLNPKLLGIVSARPQLRY